MTMRSEAAEALAVIRECVEADRVVVLPHFSDSLRARNLMWTDVLAVLEQPDDVRDGGPETLGRPKWIVAGAGADGQPLEAVCILDTDEHGSVTVFVTIY
ncbi:MAG: DUF4258 domain-containing protein [Planctomycetes bacterium]|nr:DUF4258 domain-containing protein [Planctomycetota bacterium]